MAKKSRGKDLDEQLKNILNEMLSDGHKRSPITRSTVQRRLRLKSRSTLLLNGRDHRIDQARIQQLHDAGLNPDKKKRRNTHEEQIASLKNQIQNLEKQRDNLIEKLAMIVNGLQAKGLDVENLMLPLRPNFRKKSK